MLVFALVMSCFWPVFWSFFCRKTGFLSLFGVLATPIPIFWHFGIFAKSAKIDISELHFAQTRKSHFAHFGKHFVHFWNLRNFFSAFYKFRIKNPIFGFLIQIFKIFKKPFPTPT